MPWINNEGVAVALKAANSPPSGWISLPGDWWDYGQGYNGFGICCAEPVHTDNAGISIVLSPWTHPPWFQLLGMLRWAQS